MASAWSAGNTATGLNHQAGYIYSDGRVGTVIDCVPTLNTRLESSSKRSSYPICLVSFKACKPLQKTEVVPMCPCNLIVQSEASKLERMACCFEVKFSGEILFPRLASTPLHDVTVAGSQSAPPGAARGTAELFLIVLQCSSSRPDCIQISHLLQISAVQLLRPPAPPTCPTPPPAT